MNLSASLHLHPGDDITFGQGSADPTIMWVALGPVAIFGEPAQLLKLRAAIDKMLGEKALKAALQAAA